MYRGLDDSMLSAETRIHSPRYAGQLKMKVDQIRYATPLKAKKANAGELFTKEAYHTLRITGQICINLIKV